MNKFCNNTDILEVIELVGNVLRILLLLVPIIIIIFGIFDLYRYILTEEKNNIKLFIKRLISGLLIFFIVPFVKFIFSFVDVIDNNRCLNVFLGEDEVNLNVNNLENISSEKECEKLLAPYVWIDGSCRIDISMEDIND